MARDANDSQPDADAYHLCVKQGAVAVRLQWQRTRRRSGCDLGMCVLAASAEAEAEG